MTAFKNYTVYILLCKDNSYYTGITNDIKRRLLEHLQGVNKNSYTYRRRPVKMVFCEHFQNVKDAIAFEKQIKGWSRKKKEALINREWNKLPELSKRYSPN
ncbi:GIY-YIG nuclease family protein [Fulvivirga sediminis]|uniref:GIY-YIG nuclease family protein n=1 Tax=Fulvivirga sediminis TaxID=2803949 RepID=A0A937FDM8_9BACT|nr:GIY-YIG nuclease family protein [Fulvivirga sediminis]MBL3658834.1 GIY-YIG nuclease family protein [Fulvivirga sediminis]MBL3658835.1 GIY-YIG nuclease family protein [Fulvivirga sediminis]